MELPKKSLICFTEEEYVKHIEEIKEKANRTGRSNMIDQIQRLLGLRCYYGSSDTIWPELILAWANYIDKTRGETAITSTFYTKNNIPESYKPSVQYLRDQYNFGKFGYLPQINEKIKKEVEERIGINR